MKKYFIALFVLVLVFVSYTSFAQLLPIPTSVQRTTDTPNASNLAQPSVARPNPNIVSATVKGSVYVKKGDEKAKFKITVYKLVNNRWVNINNFSTLVKPNGEYLTVIRGEGTYRFVPSVSFDPRYKYIFSPLNHTVRITKGSKDVIFIRNFGYKKTNRK